MIRPTKHSEASLTVLPVAALLLKRLKRLRVDKAASLLVAARKEVPAADPLFAPSLSLLYLLGLVEYRSKTDSFEYVGP
jgi:ABC-three component (ABC-3C) system Middle Component 8